MRQGVIWLKDKGIDVFLVTLNKSDKDYSPTTMYNDYSINEELFHWQSQSTTSETSQTGQRYIHHKEKGSKILLFVREFKNDSFGNYLQYLTKSLSATTAYKVVLFYLKIKKAIDDDLALTLYKKA